MTRAAAGAGRGAAGAGRRGPGRWGQPCGGRGGSSYRCVAGSSLIPSSVRDRPPGPASHAEVGQRLDEQVALPVGQLGEDAGVAGLVGLNQVSSSASCWGSQSPSTGTT